MAEVHRKKGIKISIPDSALCYAVKLLEKEKENQEND